jgi:hypothetical protein
MAKKEDVVTSLAIQANDSLTEFGVANAEVAVKELLESGGELATQFIKLEDNSAPLRGLFFGFGRPHLFRTVDPKTGEVTEREAETVIIRSMSGKASVRLLGNYELVQKLADLPYGSEVLIFRGGRKTVNTQNGIRQVSEFQVLCKRSKSELKAINQ